MSATCCPRAPGSDGEPGELERFRSAGCSADFCAAELGAADAMAAARHAAAPGWSIASALTRACAAADIVVSDRRLPAACRPRWLKADRALLARSGGLAIRLGREPEVTAVASRAGRHPWAAGLESFLTAASSLPHGSRKWKRRPPGKAKIGPDDPAAGGLDRGQRGLEVGDVDHRQRRLRRLGGVGLKADIGVAGEGRGIGRAEAGQAPAERRLRRRPWRRRCRRPEARHS